MRPYQIIIISLLLIFSCKLFEDEISFTSAEDPIRTKFEVHIPDLITVTEYSKFVNNNLVERNVFKYDSVTTEKWKYDANNKLVAKKVYVFSVDNYEIIVDTFSQGGYMRIDTLAVFNDPFQKRRNAILTIESLFYDDSTLVIESEYSYNDSLVTEIRTNEYTINGTYHKKGYLKNFYDKDKNVVKVNYEVDDGLCANEMNYTDIENIVDVEKFENGLLGKTNENLVLQAYWEKGCNEEEYKVKPSSLYLYNIDENGLVIKKNEEYTPEYMEFVGTTVERIIRITEYEYIFE